MPAAPAQFHLVSHPGMVETPRLQAKRRLTKWTKSTSPAVNCVCHAELLLSVGFKLTVYEPIGLEPMEYPVLGECRQLQESTMNRTFTAAVFALALALLATGPMAQGRHDEKPHGTKKSTPDDGTQTRAAGSGGRHDEGGTTHGKKNPAAKKGKSDAQEPSK